MCVVGWALLSRRRGKYTFIFMGELEDLRAGKTLGKPAPKATETKGSFYPFMLAGP